MKVDILSGHTYTHEYLHTQTSTLPYLYAKAKTHKKLFSSSS